MSVETIGLIWTIFCFFVAIALLVVFIYVTWLLIKALKKYLREPERQNTTN
ncbi:hypothetical protein SAMN05192574_1011028 [Mucilaginibacter gossypiicola]|uniref:Uncharacterized protein n=1 Tax=Mucilaginibacter gossypiicola TaxID=551995 RepID=A0A1H8BVE2_9SPHI|nr:hypothetical protein SAMN05192574_1011028 [Mucilaginibacter gossypiicola]